MVPSHRLGHHRCLLQRLVGDSRAVLRQPHRQCVNRFSLHLTPDGAVGSRCHRRLLCRRFFCTSPNGSRRHAHDASTRPRQDAQRCRGDIRADRRIGLPDSLQQSIARNGRHLVTLRPDRDRPRPGCNQHCTLSVDSHRSVPGPPGKIPRRPSAQSNGR